MDANDLITAASAECDLLIAVVTGEKPYNPDDYAKFRELVAELKRQDDADLSLFGQKMDEWYRSLVRWDDARNKYPANSRKVRKEADAVQKAIQSIERIGDRIEASVYRKAGGGACTT